jgi:hypothetical protein
MNFKQEYIEQTRAMIMKMNPSLDEDTVEKAINAVLKESMKDPTIDMDNNVTGDNWKTTLTGLCDWVENRDPVISGNATFYCQPKEQRSPTSTMLKTLKANRKLVKKKMFKLEPTSDEYQQLDLEQQNIKVIMNAEYGGSGTPTAAFYTKYSPAATTLMAQSIITTMAAFFESFVGDNQKFYSINECYDWINRVLRKTDDIPKWVRVPTWDEVARRIKMHFITLDAADLSVMDAYIKSCTDKELTYLYYANNIKGFISENHKVAELIYNVLSTLPVYEASENEVPDEFKDRFDSVDNYNKWVSEVMFLNPYNIPESIRPYMDPLRQLLKQFIYVEYITPDSIIKLNNHKRNTVLLVDTDSNIINSNLFISFIMDTMFSGNTFNRPRMYNDMILGNMLAACLDVCVASMLDYYGRCHHMDDESRSELTMKNEFMFRRFFLMKTKKRYVASIVLREGNIMVPFKSEIKGMDFIKAAVSDDVEKRFKTMIQKHILYSDNLELHELMDDLKSFEREIYSDLKHGSTTYLKSQQLKSENAYHKDKIWSLQVYRGSAVWNAIYPSQKIYALDRVRILKLIVTGPQDLQLIANDYPNEVDNVMRTIFNSNDSNIRNAGLKIIAIPASVKKIPDWLIPLVDYDVIVSDTIASFRSVLEALDMEPMTFKTPNNKANITSGLISI